MSNGPGMRSRRMSLARRGISSVRVTQMVRELECLGRCDPKREQNETFGADSYAVDICITTDFKDLEHVCLLAEVLAKRKDEFATS